MARRPEGAADHCRPTGEGPRAPGGPRVQSHILMLRSGMIRMVSAGIYSFLPLGYRVIRKISEIIREEMNNIGGQEFHLPALNPIEISFPVYSELKDSSESPPKS